MLSILSAWIYCSYDPHSSGKWQSTSPLQRSNRGHGYHSTFVFFWMMWQGGRWNRLSSCLGRCQWLPVLYVFEAPAEQNKIQDQWTDMLARAVARNNAPRTGILGIYRSSGIVLTSGSSSRGNKDKAFKGSSPVRDTICCDGRRDNTNLSTRSGGADERTRLQLGLRRGLSSYKFESQKTTHLIIHCSLISFTCRHQLFPLKFSTFNLKPTTSNMCYYEM